MGLTRSHLEQCKKPGLINLVIEGQKQNETQQKLIKALQKDNFELRGKVSRLSNIVKVQDKTIFGLTERLNHLEKNSQTSSKPPSRDENKPKRNQSLREKTGRKPGGQFGHKGTGRSHVENPDIIISCEPASTCGQCGLEMDRRSSKIMERRQKIEVPPIKPVVTEYQKIRITCSCGESHTGTFPEGINSNIQIGPRMKSFLLYFNVVQLIPYKRLSDVCTDIFGFSISKGSIENFLEQGTQKSMGLYQQIMQKLRRSPWIGADETTKKVGLRKWWEWVWQNDDASYYAVEDSRGYKVVQKHLGENYEGTLIHDCYSAHNNTIAKSGHQQCHPHIQRDLKFLIEMYHCKWAYDLNKFLIAAQKARDKIWSNDFDKGLRQKIIRRYNSEFSRFLVKSSQQKDVLRLQKRMIKHQHSMLHFMTSSDIPYHNNGSERAIRMAKVKQKISGCFRSQRGAQRHSILLSVIQTAKKQNMNTLAAIQALLAGTLSFSY